MPVAATGQWLYWFERRLQVYSTGIHASSACFLRPSHRKSQETAAGLTHFSERVEAQGLDISREGSVTNADFQMCLFARLTTCSTYRRLALAVSHLPAPSSSRPLTLCRCRRPLYRYSVAPPSASKSNIDRLIELWSSLRLSRPRSECPGHDGKCRSPTSAQKGIGWDQRIRD